MNIKSQGIYFHQSDLKETGYYIEDINGNLVHHKYKKPSFLQRAKYYATYGYELNMNTLSTSYIYFSPWDERLVFGFMRGDAISVSKDLKKSINFSKCHIYKNESNLLYFENDRTRFIIDFFNDGSGLKLTTVDKNTHKTNLETYLYLDWDKL